MVKWWESIIKYYFSIVFKVYVFVGRGNDFIIWFIVIFINFYGDLIISYIVNFMCFIICVEKFF